MGQRCENTFGGGLNVREVEEEGRRLKIWSLVLPRSELRMVRGSVISKKWRTRPQYVLWS